jgi:hypothetical protein
MGIFNVSTNAHLEFSMLVYLGGDHMGWGLFCGHVIWKQIKWPERCEK